MLRIVHGDEVRVDPVTHLPATLAPSAPGLRPFTHQSLRQKPGQRPLPGPFRAGYHIEMGPMTGPQALPQLVQMILTMEDKDKKRGS